MLGNGIAPLIGPKILPDSLWPRWERLGPMVPALTKLILPHWHAVNRLAETRWKGDAKELSLNHTLQNMELNWRTVHFCHRLAPKRQRRRKKSHVLEFWWFLFSIMMQCARNNGTCPATALCGLYLPCGAVWAGDRHPQSQISFCPLRMRDLL